MGHVDVSAPICKVHTHVGSPETRSVT